MSNSIELFDLKNMKSIFPLILLSVSFIACNKPIANRKTQITADSLMQHVSQAIMDTNYSILDIKDDVQMFIDTLRYRAEFSPDEDVRIDAKCIALRLHNLIMDNYHIILDNESCSTEEWQCFNNIICLISDVHSTWYCPNYDEVDCALPLMNQNVVFNYRKDGQILTISMNMSQTKDGHKLMEVRLPTIAEDLISVSFYDDMDCLGNIGDEDTTAIFNRSNAIDVLPRTKNYGKTFVFGESFIDAMLTHNGMIVEANMGNRDLYYGRSYDYQILPLLNFSLQYYNWKQKGM